MGGMCRVGFVLVMVAVFSLLGSSACNRPGNTEGTTVTGAGSEETQPRPSRPSRSEIACRLHSCAPPYFCNEDKGVCERLHCLQSSDCPYNYKCDFSLNVCQ